MEQSHGANTTQDKCDTLALEPLCVCAPDLFNLASVFVYLFALEVCMHPDLPHHATQCVYLDVCACLPMMNMWYLLKKKQQEAGQCVIIMFGVSL